MSNNVYLRKYLLKSLCAIMFFIILLCLVNKVEYNKYKYNTNQKNYEIDINDVSEDKLSILKHEIYKTTVMLKENTEKANQDKINLKNSLQDISHQLKTPLTSSIIMLDNIIDDLENDIEIKPEFIKKVKKDISKISFLIQSILKLSMFESNTITFIRKEIPVKKIINSSIENIENLCDLKNIKIVVKDRSKNKIYCDYRWQVEALTNILKNAVEYSFNDSIIIVEVDKNNTYTMIKIKDFGKGMSEDETINIFKRFYKGKNSSSDSNGIGLSLAKAIIEKDNGRVIVNSLKGEGTTFSIKYFK